MTDNLAPILTRLRPVAGWLGQTLLWTVGGIAALAAVLCWFALATKGLATMIDGIVALDLWLAARGFGQVWAAVLVVAVINWLFDRRTS